MAETLTPNYGWTKPDPGASANVWGTELNSDLDAIDAQVFTNQQGMVPIGAGMLWFTPQSGLPANWLPCFGQTLNTTTYAKLFAVIGYTFGGSGANFNVPLFQGRFPMGTGNGTIVGQTGGEAAHTLTVSEMPVHAHTVQDLTHSHGIPQSGHVHPDPGHAHGVDDHGHAHSGIVRNVGGGGWFSLGTNNPQIQVGSTDASGTGIAIFGAVTNLGAALANIGGTDARAANILLFNTGGGAAHNILPPYITLIYIIKYQ